MTENHNYCIETDIKYGNMTLIDIPELIANSKEDWQNYSLTEVNDCVIRLGIVQGEFHWHKHDEEDEFFYVVEGVLFLDLEDQTIELKEKMGFTVPKGTRHRTRAPERTVMLMVEKKTVTAVGDKDS